MAQAKEHVLLLDGSRRCFLDSFEERVLISVMKAVDIWGA